VKQGSGGVIASVERESLAARAGLQPGDRLIAIDDRPLRDIIDVQFYGAEEMFDLLVERGGEQWWIRVGRDYDEELGLTFVNPTFDVDIRRCANNCEFCFVKQNARGMRRSLYIKDDDYRYSFLFGNFVTLTNLTDDDWSRLEEQRLSPLYVSVHATDLELRRRFLARKSAPDVIEQLHRLAELGIEVHTQVVLVPGLNDGDGFAQTVADLTNLYQLPVASLGVVPVGLTKHHRGQCRTYTREESQALLRQVEPWRAANRKRFGSAFIYPSDEWYLVAGMEVPAAHEYDGFPQVENGVGMVRQLLDEWRMLRVALPPVRGERVTLVCGTLIQPVLAWIVEEWNKLSGIEVQLVSVVNEFFGPVTTVSGLLAGQDVVKALQGRSSDSSEADRFGNLVFLPRSMFTGRYGAGSAPPGITLDDLSLDDLSAQLGVRVEVAGTMTEVLAALE
jgi:putative radical SAM enzyme (TIGR03279 family)